MSKPQTPEPVMATSTELFQVEPQAPPVLQGRRSAMEIMCDVLDVVSTGKERPTHIIYKANISWKVLTGCLQTLISNELITKANDGKRDVYRLTEKGYSVLNLYRELKSRLLHEQKPFASDFYRGF
jgi:predicted transcriptional regulator